MKDYIKAREYIMDIRFQFDNTLSPELKEALILAEEALLYLSVQNEKITFIPPYGSKENKND